MSVQLRINDKAFNAALQKATADGLAYATQHYHTQLKIAVNKPNTGTRVRVKRQTPGGNTTSRTVYDNPSLPGEAPRKRTGFGQRGIVREIDRKSLTARVGVTKNAIYMYYLEMGTKHISPRPWLMATLNKHRAVMARLLVMTARRRVK